MTFQRRTAARLIELVRALRPGVKIVVGGYDPSLAPEAYEELDVDYLVRGEGEVTFRELLRALAQGAGFDQVCGLSYRDGETWVHNPARPPHRLEDSEIRLPNRDSRVLKGYTLLGRQVDVIQTSPASTSNSTFSSILPV